MKRLFIKICGITSPEDAALAVEAGADAIGFVFWRRSPRNLTPERAAAIAREIPDAILRVGVFVDASAPEIKAAAEAVGLDLLQLHGEEPPAALAGLSRPVLKAVRVGRGFSHDEALLYVATAAGILAPDHYLRFGLEPLSRIVGTMRKSPSARPTKGFVPSLMLWDPGAAPLDHS